MPTENQPQNPPDPTPDTSPEQAALAAMDAGINDQPMPEAPAPGSPEARAAEVKPVEGDIPGDEKPLETPPDKAAAPDKPQDKKPDQPEPDKPDPELAKEADSLGLKEKARERFFGLTADLKAAAPFREAAEKLGLKSPEELPMLAERARWPWRWWRWSGPRAPPRSSTTWPWATWSR